MGLKKLEKTFQGVGEVKGKTFRQVFSDENYYIYEITENESGKVYHELIKRVKTPVCIDFHNRVYSQSEFKETYPKSKQFGKTGWTFAGFEQCKEKIEQLKDDVYIED